MPDEPNNIINIKEYIDQRIKDLESVCSQRSDHLESVCSQRSDHLESVCSQRSDHFNKLLDNGQKAVVIALDSVDKRFNAVNEFRTQLSDQQRTFARQTDVDLIMTAVEKATLKSESATERRFECVSINTPILCADLVWRPAGELLVGDELIGFDEEAPTRHGRRFRKSIVTHNSHQQDNLFRVNTTQGIVDCNSKHPWLVFPPKGRRGQMTNWRWIKTGDLKPGDQVMRCADVWDVEKSWEAGWLAGMFDGEGCLSFSKQSKKSIQNKEGSTTSYLGVHLTLTQCESDTSDRIKVALEKVVDAVCIHRVEAGKYRHTKPFFHFIITKRSDVLKILGSIRPPRLLIKASGVWDGRPINGNHRETFVQSVENIGVGTIAALSTSTKTYIAGGFGMHNSVNEFRSQLADQQTTFVRKTEVDIRFEALEKKVDTAVAQLQLSKGRESGFSSAGGILVVVLTLVLCAVGIIVAFVSKH